MFLDEMLTTLPTIKVTGETKIKVNKVVYDSRQAKTNDIFVALKGSYVDGHSFIDQVIKQGCQIIVHSEMIEYQEGITYIQVENTRQALAKLSHIYFRYPSKELTVIGVTGTTGKTTTALMIKSILETSGKKVGCIGTNGVYIGDIHEETQNTTPESYELARLMRLMVLEGCEYCVMEVSSQALKMNRVDEIDFDFGVFTNLSIDHIGPNEHASFEEYRDCKKLLFKRCKIGLFNKDDSHYEEMIDGATCEIHTYSVNQDSELKAHDISLFKEGSHLGIKFATTGLIDDIYTLNMPGRFNVYNALVALMICFMIKVDKQDMRYSLSKVEVAGRGQIVHVNDLYTVIIDYAHNGVSFDSILSTVEEYHPHRIYTIFGMPGRRSHVRRKESGEMVRKHQAYAVLTTDDARDEDVHEICNEIISYIKPLDESHYEVIVDRKEAIYHTLDKAEENDVILILGKGHETHQVLENEVKVHYSDLETVLAYKEEHR